MSYREIEGDLIDLAYNGSFDVITHGCNCFCTMGAGIAVRMNEKFFCNDPNRYHRESPAERGNADKLGTIEHKAFSRPNGTVLMVVNSYTQYYYGSRNGRVWKYGIPLDYDALTMCLRKLNFRYPGQEIGLPKIGCSLAGGNWNRVREIIKEELHDMLVTVVLMPKVKPSQNTFVETEIAMDF